MKRMLTKINFAGERAKQRGRAKAIRSLLSGKLPKRVIAMLLCVCMTAAMLCNLEGLMVAKAAEATESAMKRVADGDTSDTYDGKLLSSEWGSRYAGRVWTDKSVFKFGDDINLDMATDGYDGKIHFDSDFGTVFSALTSSQELMGVPPVRTVIVFDNSGSMYKSSNTTADSAEELWQKQRIAITIEAINRAVDILMEASVYNEVAVVLFGDGAQTGREDSANTHSYHGNNTAVTILPMKHYTPQKSAGSNDNKYTPYLTGGWNNPNDANRFNGESPCHTGTGEGGKSGAIEGGWVFVNNEICGLKNYNGSSVKYTAYANGTTNIQAGYYVGMQELMNAKKTVKVGNDTYKCIPSLVMLTDGAATDKMSGDFITPKFKEENGVKSQYPTDIAFVNDTGNKLRSFTGYDYTDNSKSIRNFWDMFVETDKNGNYKSVVPSDGYDKDNSSHRPTGDGLTAMKKVANTYSDSVASMLLGTLMTTAYYKAAVKKAYDIADDKSWAIYSLSVDMVDMNKVPTDAAQDAKAADSNTAPKTELPEKWKYDITSNAPTMDPSKFFYKNGEFSLDWLIDRGYIDSKDKTTGEEIKMSDLLNDPEKVLEHTAYPDYSVGEMIIHGIVKAGSYLKKWENSSEVIKTNFQGWSEVAGILKDNATNWGNNQKVNVFSHSNGYLLEEEHTIEWPQIDTNDKNKVKKQDVLDNIAYNTSAFYASTAAGAAENLAGTFQEIVVAIMEPLFVPVSGENASGVADSITYQDPLGEYMELKNGAITVEGDVTGSSQKTFDMSLLLFGEMHGMVRAGVYDYQWNYDYMHNNGTKEGYPADAGRDPNNDPLRIGWYKGDALNAVYSYVNGLPAGCDTAEKAWADGWVLRLNYKTLAEYVPLSSITDEMKPTEVPEQIKHTVYTCYRFADSQVERNKLRRNPIFGEVSKGLQDDWQNYFDTYGSYPVGMDFYSDYSGVYRLSDIRVWTEHTGDFVDQDGTITPEEEGGYDDALYVNLPIAAVPTQLAEITIGADGPISYKDNLNDKKQSTPLRLFYAVGLAEDLIARDANGKQTGVDVSKISGEYIATHSDPENNSIYFISNWYSNTAYRGYTSDDAAEYHTRGDAAVTLSPNAKNRYYLFQKALPLIAHAYRVKNEDGDVAPVDNAENVKWEANGAGNGKTTWETVDGAAQSAASWVGGEFIGTYDDEASFKAALANKKKLIDGSDVWYITDDKGYTYPLPAKLTDAIITYTKDQLSKIDSDGDGYTEDSNSFSSDDYFFLCIEYYLPMDGTGKDIQGDEDPDTQAVRKVSRMIARKGSAFGSGLHSENIDNGDMLCWTDINGNCNLEIEYNSRTDTGDDTRGRPTLEKLTLKGASLREYLQTLGLHTEPEVGEQSYLDLDCAYWESVQADPHMAALIEQITILPTADEQQAKFDELFDWSAAARTGGIRVGDMFNNMQAKGGGGTLTDGYYEGNVTKTANNYYIPTLSETSTAGDGLVINNYLGNNGRLEIANATLMVTKTLVAPDGFTLTEEQQNETFHYQVYVQGLTGERLAQRLKWNPFSQSWQKRVETLDILTDNSSLLLDTSGSRALFCYSSGVPRQIVEVYEDGVAKYYYADATGAATNEPCNDSFDHFYYLYLPDSAGELNYHLFASTYEAGTTDLDGVGTTAYYPAGMDKSQLPAGDNSNQHFAEAVTGKDDPLANRPAGSREYWTNQAELIPYDEVKAAETVDDPEGGGSSFFATVAASNGNHWSYTEGSSGYIKLTDPFPLVTVIPDPEGTDSTIYSPYSSRTQYMTVPLYFGYTADLAEHLKVCDGGGAFASCKDTETYKLDGGGLYDRIIPTVDRPDLFNATFGNATADDVAKNTAAYTLRSGEGLMLTGLGNRITYRFTEKLTDTQIEQGYLLKKISHIQQRGSDTVYMPGVQNIEVEGNSEPFAHTNATIWESYATMAAGSLGNHHQPEASEGVAQNPNCNDAKTEANLDVGRCDIVQKNGSTRHYFYYGGKLVDPHYRGEQDGMSRYVLNPTAHFGIADETVTSDPAKNPASGKYDYNGVYSVFGNTGYFTEQANYTNTVDPELFVLEKGLVDLEGNKVTVPPDQEFTFTLTFEPTDSAAMTDMDGTLHYWKGNKDSWESALEWEDTGGNQYKMPTKAPKLDEYEPYLTDPTYRLKPIEPDKGTKHTYTITLKANEAIVFYGVIAGTKFTVTETKNESYPVEPSAGSINDGYTQTGTIYRASEDPQALDPVTTSNRASFTNRLLTGLLMVEKRIKDADPDTKKEFDFTVTLTPAPHAANLKATKYKADGTAYDASEFTIDWNEESGSQKAKVTLKHGEKLLIEGIPLNTVYTVEESQKDGYNLQHIADNPTDTPDANGNYLTRTGNSVTGTITTKAMQEYLLFVNERAPFLPFIGGIGIGAFLLTGVLLIGLATASIVKKRCKRRRTAQVGG